MSKRPSRPRADPHPSPVERLIEQEQQAVAAELISALPDDSREVLLLYYCEGQSSQQVARLLGLSDTAVRERLSRARASVREDLLRRFSEFARSSAPGAAFASVVTAALGTAKPASAAGLVAAGSTVTVTTIGKFLAGSLLSAGSAWSPAFLPYGRKYLFGFTETEAERAVIRRWVRGYSIVSLAAAVAALLAAAYTPGWQASVAAMVLALLVINYPLRVTLPRLMNPMLARDAQRRSDGAQQRRMSYRLIRGSTGTLIANIGLIGSAAVALLASGRLG